MLETTKAIHLCDRLQLNLARVHSISMQDQDNLCRAVSQIHTCLTKRVEFVQASNRDLAPNEAPTFYGTPFSIPEVVKVLNDLAWSSKANFISHLL